MACVHRWHSTVLKWVLLVTLLSGCCVLFWKTYRFYQSEPSFYYVHQMLGSCLCISRASAAVLNLTCGMAVFPVCRVTVTSLRYLNAQVKLRTMRMLLDSCKGFHICCAYLIIGISIIHFIAHMVNARNFSMYYNPVYKNVNAASYRDEDPIWIILTTIPGITGLLMMIILSLIVSSSVSHIRHNDYDLFWYSHRLFVVFYVLLVVHALNGPIRKQINLNRHTPGCLYFNGTAGNMTIPQDTEPVPEAEYNIDVIVCFDEPRFTRIGCYSWLWVSGPLFLYLCDTLFRFARRQKTVKLISVTQHPSDVIELHMERGSFTARPGQFILVQCPTISPFEWHPFSLTTCPVADRQTFSVHVRTRGDWSGNLKDLLTSEEPENSSTRNCLRVDGPFSSPMEDIAKFRVVMCVAGGIGVTPFISLLSAIREGKSWTKKLYRVLLIWVCREENAFMWFVDMMKACHIYCWENGRPDLLDIRLFSSRGTRDSVLNLDDFVRKRVQNGRPDWKEVFSQLESTTMRSDVGVFACGPRGLVDEVGRSCDRKDSRLPRIYFYHESY